MRPRNLSHWLLLLPLFACGPGPGGNRADEAYYRAPLTPLMTQPMTMVDLLAFDLVHRTCALYVAVRSRALDTEIAFGRDIDQDMVHWNLCPGGTMVACASVPAANGDPMLVGIPLPQGFAAKH
jgi:hypothetical protein